MGGLLEHRLDGHDLVAFGLDGKTFAEDEFALAVGVTPSGENTLEFVETATETRTVSAAFLREPVERGLRVDVGRLVVTDAKGFCAAVREVFSDVAALRRCPGHKRSTYRLRPNLEARGGYQQEL